MLQKVVPIFLALFYATSGKPYDVVKPFNVDERGIYAAQYSDSFARNVALPLSAAAYSDNPQACLTNVFQGQLKRQISVKCDGFNGDRCSGFTAVLPTQKAIVISFRGTSGFLQLLEEANDSIFHSKVKFIGGGEVNLYFFQGFMDIWNGGMKDDFLTLKSQYPGYELWITGHSLGGAMASLASSYIVSTGLFSADNIKLVTMGQPRTGDSDWAALHDKQIPYTFRLTHSHDMVAHIPNEFAGYRHHMIEVFYSKDDMGPGAKYTVCYADESDSCSDGNFFDLSIEEHTHYFDVSVSGFGDSGCK